MVHDLVALAEFLDGLGNPVEGFGQGLDVLPLQRGDEDFHEFLADGFRILFLIAAGHGQFGQRDMAVGFLQSWARASMLWWADFALKARSSKNLSDFPNSLAREITAEM